MIMPNKLVEVISKRLYFSVIKDPKSSKLKNISKPTVLYFNIDDDKEFIYHGFANDFGPLNISCLYKYTQKVNRYLRYFKGRKKVVHCTNAILDKKTNAAFLLGAYLLITSKMNFEEVCTLLINFEPFKLFVDAGQGPCTNFISIFECLKAIVKAVKVHFFNFSDFNVNEYDLYDDIQYGNMNWIVPRKFLALIGPIQKHLYFYVKYFLQNDIKTVIRLNSSKTYDPTLFIENGIEHFDLFFIDGSAPSQEILQKFLKIVEKTPTPIAVHCKAGLGRTGTLIAAYIMKHYQMKAHEAIAWIRICRPGSVIGPQQEWLEQLEELQIFSSNKIMRHKYGIYSKQWPLMRAHVISEARRKTKCASKKKLVD